MAAATVHGNLEFILPPIPKIANPRRGENIQWAAPGLPRLVMLDPDTDSFRGTDDFRPCIDIDSLRFGEVEDSRCLTLLCAAGASAPWGIAWTRKDKRADLSPGTSLNSALIFCDSVASTFSINVPVPRTALELL